MIDISGVVHLLPELALLVTASVFAGFIAGLFGIGGGTVTVPVLYYWFLHMHISPDVAMHSAVATSLAGIIPTSLSSANAHHKRGSLDKAIVKNWAPVICIGSVLGVVLASLLSGNELRGVFGGFLTIVAGYMLLASEGQVLRAKLPSLLSQR